MGSEAHKLEIFIDEYNQALVNANWYYNSCIQSAQHTYEFVFCKKILNFFNFYGVAY